MINGGKCCDSVLIYCHQDPEKNADKYQVIKKVFNQWSGMTPLAPPKAKPVFKKKPAERTASLYGCIGTYGTPPRLSNGRADLARLINELTDIHANTFHFALHQNETDWDDMKLLLPMAHAKGINV